MAIECAAGDFSIKDHLPECAGESYLGRQTMAEVAEEDVCLVTRGSGVAVGRNGGGWGELEWGGM